MPKPFRVIRRVIVFLFSALLIFLPASLAAQTTPVTSSAAAVNLAGQALRSLVGGTALSDITIQANANYFVGSDDETGTAVLIARGNAQSQITLNTSDGRLQEMRNGAEGAWTLPDGTARSSAMQNCLIDADWFFPAFSLSALGTDPTQSISLIGQEARAGLPVWHLVVFHGSGGKVASLSAVVLQASVMDLYLDVTTLRPVELDFNTYPENGAPVAIPIQILFGAYQQFQEVWVPTKIQKYIQNNLQLDLTVTNATLNSGISASAFTLPVIPDGGTQ